MSRNTEDPSNKPEYCHLRDSQWRNTTESCRQTILKTLNDPVSVKAYYRFQQMFEGWQKVRESLNDAMESLGVESVYLSFLDDLKGSIDPLARVIYRDVDDRIQELKEEKREVLGRLLQKSVNEDDISEVRRTILEELENLGD